MGVTVGIGVTVVFLAWTSSKVLYVLKVFKKIVKKIPKVFKKIVKNILRKNLNIEDEEDILLAYLECCKTDLTPMVS